MHSKAEGNPAFRLQLINDQQKEQVAGTYPKATVLPVGLGLQYLPWPDGLFRLSTNCSSGTVAADNDRLT